jgi:putative DNA primase/helicase
MTLREFLGRLKGVRRSGSGWMALCPVHEDHDPSLSIREDGGRILLYCHAG